MHCAQGLVAQQYHVNQKRWFYWNAQHHFIVRWNDDHVFLLVLKARVAHRWLNANQITSIENGGFTGLGKLNFLSVVAMLVIRRFYSILCLRRSLRNNKLTSVESGDFTGLSSLTTLSVWSSLVFKLVPSWWAMYRELYSNQIASIDNDSFAALGSLSTLLVIAILSIFSCSDLKMPVEACTPTTFHPSRVVTLLDLAAWLFCKS